MFLLLLYIVNLCLVEGYIKYFYSFESSDDAIRLKFYVCFNFLMWLVMYLEFMFFKILVFVSVIGWFCIIFFMYLWCFLAFIDLKSCFVRAFSGVVEVGNCVGGLLLCFCFILFLVDIKFMWNIFFNGVIIVSVDVVFLFLFRFVCFCFVLIIFWLNW